MERVVRTTAVMIETRSKLRSAPTTQTTATMKVAGRSCGRTMCQSSRQPWAPSSRAASTCSRSIAVEPGQIEDHAIGGLRPKAGEDDREGRQCSSSRSATARRPAPQ